MQRIIMTLTLAMIGSSLCVAQESNSKAEHIGDKIASVDTLIDALKPKPNYKTRGIRFNHAPQQPAAAPQPAVAMGINFAHDSDQLSEQAIGQLKPLGEALNSQQLAEFSFHIDGHTDATGSDQYNIGLSERRAISVGQHLYQVYGVEISRLVLTGKGEAELYDEENPESGVNRRVEIRTIVK